MSDLTSVLQTEFDEAWEVFCERHTAICRGVHDHEPADLIGNLDQCPLLDDDAMANFAYGTLLTIRYIAGEMHVALTGHYLDVRVGRVARRVH